MLTEAAGPVVRPALSRRAVGLVAGLAVLALVLFLSVSVGTRSIPLGTVWDAIVHFDGSPDQLVVRDLRVPRTVLGLAVGAALGLAGALMQALTRNPLADPGILGVNAGSALAVVCAIAFFGVSTLTGYVWFALAGALIATVLAYTLGSVGRSAATPVRLALAGTAIGAVLTGFTSAVVLFNQTAFNGFRAWSVGSLAGRDAGTVRQVLPFLLVGIVAALALAGPLNAIAFGEDLARALGAHIVRTRVIGVVAVTLLCGAATAAIGPVSFLGLTVPHIARAITGPDHRWLLPYSMVLSATLLLGSDVVGRVVAPPGELQVGLVTTVIGAPVFVALVRRRRLAQS
ncbi:FecCD family ABC transporter permease [Phytohabitans rumicis]|uniref:Iron ABC transporter permease n=1 Tax=Phytohabitans rumicis TaxID=1076125 RepID=A0A6V8LGS2_9ACTN|nr:iron chelate uptake ABC transporter family permease subunit [Phytohabitans rumicis]GFJ94840.1 iron ABC transporter permease [Phytohabitans rumicis]